jgi:hypothetical protein
VDENDMHITYMNTHFLLSSVFLRYKRWSKAENRHIPISPTFFENTSYSAMLNIPEPVPHPESITTNSSDSGITSTRYPTEFLPIPSNSGIPIYMDDRQAISLKHASNSGTEFRNYIETESVPAIPEFPGIPSNSYQFPPIPTNSASI